jgi:hypothetical protein
VVSTPSTPVGGGGGRPPPPHGSSITAAQASTDAAQALCTRINDCAPTFLTLAYGTVSECQTRNTATIGRGIGANGSTLTPDQLDACAKAIPTTSCADMLGRNLPPACHGPAGTLADGSPCSDDAQCLNKKCKSSGPNTTCGTCGSPVATGGACTARDDCADGLACAASVCVAFGAMGSTCDSAHPCNSTLGCVSGKCAAPQAVGAPCKMQSECDQVHGIICDGKVCSKLALVSTGTCGLINGAYTLCQAGATCTGIGAMGTGTCTPAPKDGETCDVDGGAKCEDPAKCVNGKCTTSDPATCK